MDNFNTNINKELIQEALEKAARENVEFIEKEVRHRDIVRVQKTQTEILNQQKIFTGILAIATTILAIGTLLQVLFYFVVNEKQIGVKEWMASGIFILLGFLIGIIVGVLIHLFKMYKKMKLKKDQLS